MTFNELDIHLMIGRMKLSLAEVKAPEPGPFWQYSEWVHTMQTILELEKILDSWICEGTHGKKYG